MDWKKLWKQVKAWLAKEASTPSGLDDDPVQAMKRAKARIMTVYPDETPPLTKPVAGPVMPSGPLRPRARKRPFPFPAVPDDEGLSAPIPGQRGNRFGERSGLTMGSELASERSRSNTPDTEPRPAPFRPTDVPSPVFGFRSRPQRPSPPRSEGTPQVEQTTPPAAKEASTPSGEETASPAEAVTRAVEEAAATRAAEPVVDVEDTSRVDEGIPASVNGLASAADEAAPAAEPAVRVVEGVPEGEDESRGTEGEGDTPDADGKGSGADPDACPPADAVPPPVAYTVRYAIPPRLKAQLAAQNVPFNVLARPVPGSIAIVRFHGTAASDSAPGSTADAAHAEDSAHRQGRADGVPEGSGVTADHGGQRPAPAGIGASGGHPAMSGAPQSKAVGASPERSDAAAAGDDARRDADTPYVPPSLDLLDDPLPCAGEDEAFIAEQMRRLEETLRHFHVRASVTGATHGPTVTRFEVQPEPGVKVSRITALADDIKLNLAARDIRIEAPIPGRSAVGIEVPNRTREPVFLKRIVAHEAFQHHPSPLAVAVGVDIGGDVVVADLRKMPHLLIAGATGSGKSVCINALLISLLYKASPEVVRLLLIDPKMVELTPYQDIPHLVAPVVTDAKLATAALQWAVQEMERRYELFARCGARDLERYNRLAKARDEEGTGPLPYIVIVIDELADLMMVAPGDVEEAICRIAQKARACGIHLVLATQRPSVDVITGLIKANIPTRIAFAVSSQADSRTILDMAGAEKLLGRGDMLYLDSGDPKPRRLQGCFVSDEEIERVVAHVRRQREAAYWFDRDDLLRSVGEAGDVDDELLAEAVRFVIEQGQASASMLQRRFRIGYNRAARLIDAMEARGWISAPSGSKPRTVHITEQEYRDLFDRPVHPA